MKTEVQKCITKPENIEILGITLLSRAEFQVYREHITNINCRWWLRSPATYEGQVWVIDGRTNEPDFSYLTDNPCIHVRPALKITFDTDTFTIGDKFKFKNETWTIISTFLAICDNHIGEHYFRNDLAAKDANDYMTSDIKKYLEQWLATDESGFATKNDIKKYIVTVEEHTTKKNTIEIEAQSEEEAMKIAKEKYVRNFGYDNTTRKLISAYDPQKQTETEKIEF